ncbi:MAG: tetratricopeptide repeat protein [Bacteroidales bacterium]|nr:tetratricopeptide repeat protein [Bacteroidales bacterium]
MKRLEYILILLTISFASCTSNLITVSDLMNISANMQEYPKQVLDTLSGIKVEQLKNKEANALYALLYSQAMDKNWIDETDDSLITVAVDYYEHTNDIYNKFLAYYYSGRVYQNAGDYTKAIIAFTKSEDLADKIEDDYNIGLLYANLGLLYQKVYDFTKSLESFKNAYNHYIAAQKYNHSMYVKLNIGNVLLSMQQFGKAEEYLQEFMRWSFAKADYITCRDGFRMLVSLYLQTGESQKLKNLLGGKFYAVCKGDPKFLHYNAYLSALNNDFRSAQEYLHKAWKVAKSGKDSATLYHRSYQINKLLGNYRAALDCHERYFLIQDISVARKLSQPIITAQKDHYKNEAIYNELQLKYNREKFTIIIIAAIVILVLVTLLYVYRMNSKQRRIEGYMDKIQDLERSLFHANMDKDSVAMEMTEKISDLFITQFDLIDKLSTTYYETHGFNRDKDAIYKQVTKEIEKLSTDKKYLAQLEEIVNNHMDGVMKKTRNAVPQLSEIDFRMLCYMYAGFSAKAISIFTNNSTGSIYMKKSRFKDKISSSGSCDIETILKYLR